MYFNGFSFGFAFSPAQTANMATITAAETSHASTLQNTLRQAGSAAGVALLGTVLAATGAGARDLAGYHLAFLAAAGLMALALVCSCFVSDADAAPTMAARASVDSLAMNSPDASLPAAAAPAWPRGQVFRYEGFTADAERGLLTCRYSLDGRDFAERVTLAPGPGWDTPAAQAAARLVYLLAGVSYYKTAAPPVIDLGDTALTERELAFLREFYLAGLGEYAYRNGLDLSDLRFEATVGPRHRPPSRPAARRARRRAAGPRLPCRGAAAADPVRRGHRLDRDGGGHPRAHRRHRAVRGQPAGGPVRRHRAAGRGQRAAGDPGRAGDRPAAAPVGRARLPQRARAGHRDHLRHRRPRRRAQRPGHGGHVQRVVGLGADPRAGRRAGQPPVVQVGCLRGQLPRAAGGRAGGPARATSPRSATGPSCGWPSGSRS